MVKSSAKVLEWQERKETRKKLQEFNLNFFYVRLAALFAVFLLPSVWITFLQHINCSLSATSSFSFLFFSKPIEKLSDSKLPWTVVYYYVTPFIDPSRKLENHAGISVGFCNCKFCRLLLVLLSLSSSLTTLQSFSRYFIFFFNSFSDFFLLFFFFHTLSFSNS